MNTTDRAGFLGFGLGLRVEHYTQILESAANIDWFEVLTENYLVPGGKPLHYLDRIAERYPVSLHGVSLSIGSVDPINFDYLEQVRALASRVDAHWISDHLCWTARGGINAHDLLPLPYTEEALKHVVERVCRVQDFLGQRLVLENVSSYVGYHSSTMPEWEFFVEIARRADCRLLVDVNNIYVSAINHEFNPKQYIDHIPADVVQQIHLAGHTQYENYIVDTHDHLIVEPVWDLYAYACERFGRVSTMIERDDNIPPLTELITELNRVRQIAQGVWSKAAA